MKFYYKWTGQRWEKCDPLEFGHGVHYLKVVEEEETVEVTDGEGQTDVRLFSRGTRRDREKETRFPIILRLVKGDGGNS